MKNVTVTKVVTVSINLTSEQWELYTSIGGHEEAAAALNKDLENIFNSVELTDREKQVRAYNCLDDFAEFGAADSESRYVLEDLFKLIF
jgi:hypothetical protein